MYEKSIKDMRKRTGLSQSKFAALYNIPLKTLQQWEQGSHNPPQYVLTLLDKALNTDNHYICPYLYEIVSNPDYTERFMLFRSNIMHLIKENELNAISEILKSQVIPVLFKRKDYKKGLYLLSCIDTLCINYDLPLCSDYEQYRSMKLREELWLCDDEKTALPEFKKHNIFERSIDDVY